MLQHSKKYCINGCSRPVFAYSRCIYCYRKEILLPKQQAKPKKIYKIKNYSDKRVILNDEYTRKKKEKWKQLVLEGKNRCYFTNAVMDPNVLPDFHHSLGKDGDLLCDMNYAFPCYFKPHRDYHDLKYGYDQLERVTWYKDFLARIKISNPILYYKECRKLDKANNKVNKYDI